jgi:uncharacterized protein YegJ (DUF2314 family)
MPGAQTLVSAHVGAVAISVATACHGWILDLQKHQLFTPMTLAEYLPAAGRVDGTLDNDPEKVPGLALGERVRVKFEDLSDFIHTRRRDEDR